MTAGHASWRATRFSSTSERTRQFRAFRASKPPDPSPILRLWSSTTEPLNVHGQFGKEVSVIVRTTSGEQKIEGSDILVAAGRIPNTAGIGLDKAGVELDGRGYIRVNERLETTASG